MAQLLASTQCQNTVTTLRLFNAIKPLGKGKDKGKDKGKGKIAIHINSKKVKKVTGITPEQRP